MSGLGTTIIIASATATACEKKYPKVSSVIKQGIASSIVSKFSAGTGLPPSHFPLIREAVTNLTLTYKLLKNNLAIRTRRLFNK